MAHKNLKRRLNLKPPTSRPNMLKSKPQMVIDSFDINREKYPIVLLGVRGYYLNSFGKKGLNDRNYYDDAIFVDIRLKNKSVCYSFNANTDPSYVRQGVGTSQLTKGMFLLDPGVYYAHKIGKHNGKYTALVQWDRGEKSFASSIKEGKVKGHRDGGEVEGVNEPYPVTWGHYDINIHKGGEGKNQWTWSEGCQTIPMSQWNEFIRLIRNEMRAIYGEANYEKKTIPYCLITQEDHQRLLKNQKSSIQTANENNTTNSVLAEAKAAAAIAKQVAKDAINAEKKAAQVLEAAKKAAQEATAASKIAEKAAIAATKTVEKVKKDN